MSICGKWWIQYNIYWSTTMCKTLSYVILSTKKDLYTWFLLQRSFDIGCCVWFVFKSLFVHIYEDLKGCKYDWELWKRCQHNESYKVKLNCLLRQSNEKQELQKLTLINSRNYQNYITKTVSKYWCFDQRRKICERKSLGNYEDKEMTRLGI